jgi:hypothetical protein
MRSSSGPDPMSEAESPATAKQSRPGSWMSSSTASGRSSPTAASASAPEAASTTPQPSASRIHLASRRKSAWSSTASTTAAATVESLHAFAQVSTGLGLSQIQGLPVRPSRGCPDEIAAASS